MTILNVCKTAKTPCCGFTTESTLNSPQPEYLHSPQVGKQGNQENAGKKQILSPNIILKLCVMVN